jgi:colanic acid biosynthesis glycosyl transferase WcaI
LRNDRGIVFVFIGDGAQRAALVSESKRRELTNVLFKPSQPRARLGETLALGDLHLVTLRAGCEHCVFPSKLYGITAIGRPVIFLGPPQCEIARLIADRRFGFAFAPTEVEAIAASICSLRDDPSVRDQFGAAAAAFAAAGGGIDAAVSEWDRLLTTARVLAAPPAGS